MKKLFFRFNEKQKKMLVENFKHPCDILVENEIIKDPTLNGVYSDDAKKVKGYHITMMMF